MSSKKTNPTDAVPPVTDTPDAAPPIEATDDVPPVTDTPAGKSSLGNLIEAVMPHVPASFKTDVESRLVAAGRTDMSAWSHPTDDVDRANTRYIVSSIIQEVTRNHALNLHALAFNGSNPGTGLETDVCGLNLLALYPDATVTFAGKLRRELGAGGFHSVRDLADRSAPARLGVVFSNVIRTDDYGIDGNAFETVALKFKE
jgi:hypothetical protein